MAMKDFWQRETRFVDKYLKPEADSTGKVR